MMSSRPDLSDLLVSRSRLSWRENRHVVVADHVHRVTEFISMIELTIRTTFVPKVWVNYWIFTESAFHPVMVIWVGNERIILGRFDVARFGFVLFGFALHPSREFLRAFDVWIMQVVASAVKWAVFFLVCNI